MRSSTVTREFPGGLPGLGQTLAKFSSKAASAIMRRTSEKAKLVRPFTLCRRFRICLQPIRIDPGQRNGHHTKIHKRVFGLVIDFGTSQSPKSTLPLTTYSCPSRPGHQALRKLVAAPYLPPNDWTPHLDAYFASPLALCARRPRSAASRLLESTRLRFALHG